MATRKQFARVAGCATVLLLVAGTGATAAALAANGAAPATGAPRATGVAPATDSVRAATAARAPDSASVATRARRPAGSKTAAAAKPTVRPRAAKPGPTALHTSSSKDNSMTLRGGQEGTVFRTLTVEGEDRVHFEFERPALDFDLDPEQAPGLDPASARAAIVRSAPDLTEPLLGLTAREASPYLARPWLDEFNAGSVARFRPDVKGIDSWRLVVADSRGQAVASFEGRGDPPREIAWDGRTRSGRAAVPGFTYSYVFEAHDRAGNKRNFVGEGFRIPAYRIDTVGGPVLVCSGDDLGSAFLSHDPTAGPAAAPPIVLEAASWINHTVRPEQKLRVTVTARAFDRANAISAEIARQLGVLTIGNPTRIQAVAQAETDSPPSGTVRIEAVN